MDSSGTSASPIGSDPVNTPDDLRPGDILFYSPSDLVGVLIAIKTWTWLSHVNMLS